MEFVNLDKKVKSLAAALKMDEQDIIRYLHARLDEFEAEAAKNIDGMASHIKATIAAVPPELRIVFPIETPILAAAEPVPEATPELPTTPEKLPLLTRIRNWLTHTQP